MKIYVIVFQSTLNEKDALCNSNIL